MCKVDYKSSRARICSSSRAVAASFLSCWWPPQRRNRLQKRTNSTKWRSRSRTSKCASSTRTSFCSWVSGGFRWCARCSRWTVAMLKSRSLPSRCGLRCRRSKSRRRCAFSRNSTWSVKAVCWKCVYLEMFVLPSIRIYFHHSDGRYIPTVFWCRQGKGWP